MTEATNEDEVLRGYVRLVEAMLLNVLDRIRIKDSWKKKRSISRRMYNRKMADILELKRWLRSKGATIWFTAYGLSTGRDAKQILGNFRRICGTSQRFMKSVKIARKRRKTKIQE